LSDAEIQKLVMEWQDVQGKAELNQATINREVKTMEAKLNKYNMATLGEIPTQCDNGAFRILACQMGGCLGKEVRELKVASTERLITKYEINLSTFMELNYNWATVDSLANLASWFRQEEREIRSAAANNCHKTQTRHQLGGTGMVCRHEFLQYARKPSCRFPRIRKMVLVAILLQPYSRHKNCHGLQDRQQKVDRSAHRLSTAGSLHATPQPQWITTTTL
jgi:hypothetical protein